MTLTRRGFAALAVGGTASLAGCNVLEGPVTFESSPAAATDSALSATGYTKERSKQPTLSRTFAGKEVKVTNHLREYQKEVDLGAIGSAKVGVFVAFTTPQVKVAGQGPFNPVADWSNKKIVKQLQSRFESLNNVEKVGSKTISTLGTSTKVGKFSATTTYQGTQLDLFIHITKVKHEDDFVLLLGVYPQQKPSEGENIFRLMATVTHPA